MTRTMHWNSRIGPGQGVLITANCSLLPLGLGVGWVGTGRGIILVSRVGDSRPYSLEDCPS